MVAKPADNIKRKHSHQTARISQVIGKDGPSIGHTTLEDHIAYIRSDALKEHQREARELRNGGDEDGYKALKDTSPAVIFAGTYESRRRKIDPITTSGLVFCESDGFETIKEARAERERVKEYTFVAAAYVSLSGHGVHVVVALDEPPPGSGSTQNLQNQDAWRVATVALKIDPERIDPSVKNINRLSFACHDANAYIADKVTPLAWARPRNRRSLDAITPPDDYNSWLGWLGTLKSVGFTLADVDAWSRQGASYQDGEVEERWEGLPTDEVADARNKLWGFAVNLTKPASSRLNSFNSFNSSDAPVETEFPAQPEKAFEGLAGELVQRLDMFTEADPVGVLASILAFVGNVVGTGPHCMVGGTKHSLKFWPVLVGDTAVSRKGDGWKMTAFVAGLSSPRWNERVRLGGLSSGEGMIWEVRDEITKWIKGKEELVDPGVLDKRLTIVETEFARVLQSMERQGNTLSAIVRQAYDGEELRTLTKNTPANSTGAHVTLIAHITREELLRSLYEVEVSNGFANRFTFLAVRRSKLLPEPDVLEPSIITDLTDLLSKRLVKARGVGLMQRTPKAKARWAEIYDELSEPPDGMVGSLVARAAPQIVRLSAIYALLDGKASINSVHLERAYDLYQYAEKSARYIFGETFGDPIADTIASALQKNGRLTRTEISALFGRNASSGRIAAALQVLFSKDRAHSETDTEGTGRPVEWWVWNGT